MVVISLLVAQINSITHGNGCYFVKLPQSTSKWLLPSTDTYDTNLYIESKLKVLCLLVSEIDVLLWKLPPCFLMTSKMADTMA